MTSVLVVDETVVDETSFEPVTAARRRLRIEAVDTPDQQSGLPQVATPALDVAILELSQVIRELAVYLDSGCRRDTDRAVG